MEQVTDFLATHGPSRSSLVSAFLTEQLGITPEAARQRLSRATKPIVRFPIQLLPKREAFLYHLHDRNTERFWDNFHRDLRETNSVYGAALDGVLARGGSVRKEDFAVISGAPIAQKGQVSAEHVAARMVSAGLLTAADGPESSYHAVGEPVGGTSRTARTLTEGVLLDALREWARKIGLASYNSIAIRGETHSRQVGPFVWDLTGPSYLLPLRNGSAQPGFLVADVFAEGRLNEFHIRYFIRKARMSKAALKGPGIFPILLAESFTGAALTEGHRAGIMLATHADLFGRRIAGSLQHLLATLSNAAAMVSGNPARLEEYIVELNDIEGRAGNLRGIVFHLLSAHLLRRNAVSIDFGVSAFDSATGKSADIDVLAVTQQRSHCTLVECKGKQPGGVVQLPEIEAWLARIPTFNAYLKAQLSLRESKARFEFWTSGTFSRDALSRLTREKAQRTRNPIDWKDGEQVLALAREGKQKVISDAMFEHFLRHPLSEVAAIPTAA